MAERPILFSGPMVQAILAGRKTQTRRVLRPRRDRDYGCDMAPCELAAEINGGNFVNAPYCPGDLLWVREAWRTWRDFDHLPPSRLTKTAPIFFEADRDNCDRHGRYRHARFMPRWASRLTLRVTAVKVTRLQEISNADAVAEGLEGRPGCWIDYTGKHDPHGYGFMTSRGFACHERAGREAFRDLWSSINGPDSWEANPWVAAYTFERVKP